MPTPPSRIHSPLASFLARHSRLTTPLVSLSYHLIIKHCVCSLLLLCLATVCHRRRAPTVLPLYCCLEVIFYLVFIYRRHRLLASQPSLLPAPRPCPELRKKILHGILDSFHSLPPLRACLSGWFYDPNHALGSNVELDCIHGENMAELLAGIFFASPLPSLNQHDRREIQDDIKDVEAKIGHAFKPGRNPCIRPMNHTLEPVRAEHRPLLFYLLVQSFSSLVALLFFLVGFRRFHLRIHHSFSFKYWFHPGFPSIPTPTASEKKTPIIIVAGIVGLISIPHYAIYLLFTSNRPIFLVGNSSVSLTLMKPDFELIKVRKKNEPASPKTATYMRRKILTLNEQSKSMLKMMKRHGFSVKVDETSHDQERSGGAFLVGHSLGTTLIGHFLSNFPDSVAGTLSIDPISVLPYIPHLVRSFVYQEPSTVGEILVRIIAREIGVATVIQRHFHWFEFVIFPHLEHRNTSTSTRNTKPSMAGEPARRIDQHFILSEKDVIVNYPLVSTYLKTCGQPFTTLVDTPHGGFLLFHLAQVGRLTLELLQRPPTPPPAKEPLVSIPPHRACFPLPFPRPDRLRPFSFIPTILHTHHPSVSPCHSLDCHFHSVQSHDKLVLY